VVGGYAVVGTIDALGWAGGVSALVAAAAWLGGSVWLVHRHTRIENNPFRLLLALDQRIMNTRATFIASIPTGTSAAPASRAARSPASARADRSPSCGTRRSRAAR
jgi:hypothetical protein